MEKPFARRATYKRWGLEAPVVERDAFVTREDARIMLRKASYLSFGSLISRHILQPAFLEDGTEGFTRQSVEAEVRWQEDAGAWQRLRRAFGYILHYL